MSITENADKKQRYRYIRLRSGTAYVEKIDEDKWKFAYNGILGNISKAWSRLGGWGYQAGNFRDSSGNPIDITIHGTEKTLNMAIQHAYEFVMHSRKKK